jgi:hypothetical protein
MEPYLVAGAEISARKRASNLPIDGNRIRPAGRGAVSVDNKGWSPYGAPCLQRLANGRKSHSLKNTRKTVATVCDQLRPGAHRKEGVDGSSPSEGSAKPRTRAFVFGSNCTSRSLDQVWSLQKHLHPDQLADLKNEALIEQGSQCGCPVRAPLLRALANVEERAVGVHARGGVLGLVVRLVSLRRGDPLEDPGGAPQGRGNQR